MEIIVKSKMTFECLHRVLRWICMAMSSFTPGKTLAVTWEETEKLAKPLSMTLLRIFLTTRLPRLFWLRAHLLRFKTRSPKREENDTLPTRSVTSCSNLILSFRKKTLAKTLSPSPASFHQSEVLKMIRWSRSYHATILMLNTGMTSSKWLKLKM